MTANTIKEYWDAINEGAPDMDEFTVKQLRAAFSAGVCAGSMLTSKIFRTSKTKEDLAQSLSLFSAEIDSFSTKTEGRLQ